MTTVTCSHVACFSSSSCFFIISFFAHLCFIHRLSQICLGLCKHALTGTHPSPSPLLLSPPLPYEKCNSPRGKCVLGRFSFIPIKEFIIIVKRCRLPQIKDVRQNRKFSINAHSFKVILFHLLKCHIRAIQASSSIRDALCGTRRLTN